MNDPEIDKAIGDKVYWRAKELLRTKIGESGFDQKLYKKYADVLSNMHDDLEAGKFYFLSGARGGIIDSKIELFLNRFAAKKLGSVTSQFPSSARFSKISEFPERIATELRNLDLAEPQNYEKLEALKESKWTYYLLVVLVSIVIISIPIGFYTLLTWIFGMLP